MSIYTDIEELEKLFMECCVDLETGEIDEAKEQDFKALRDEVLSQGFEKLCKLYTNLKADAEALKAEKARIAQRQSTAEKKVERLKGFIEFAFEASGQSKIKAGTFTISSRESQQVVLADDFKNENYGTFEFKADKTKIKQAITSGEVIEGAELVKMSNLQIR